MMAHKLPKALDPLFMASRAERLCRCQSSWRSTSHTRRPRFHPFVNAATYPRKSIDLVPTASSLISCQWQGSPRYLNALSTFSNTPHLTPKSHQWEGIQVLEDRHQGNLVSRIADAGLTNSRKEKGQNSVQLPLVNHLNRTAPSSLRDQPLQQRRNTSAMPRSGYDATNMRVAVNLRLAGSTGGKGHQRNDKPRSDGHSDGRARNGSGGSGKGEDGSRGDGDKGSKKPEEQEPERGGKDEGMTTEELIKTIDEIRIPLEGRGWTFWL